MIAIFRFENKLITIQLDLFRPKECSYVTHLTLIADIGLAIVSTLHYGQRLTFSDQEKPVWLV